MAAVGLGEELTLAKLIGAVLGIIGVAITVGGSDMTLSAEVIAATLALLGATLSYAVGGVFAKRAFTGLNNMSMSSGQLIGAAFILAPVSLADLPQQAPPMEAVWATLALVVVCTAIAYQLYYYLIISAGPTKALTVTLLVPVFGVIFGALVAAGEHQPGHHHRSARCHDERWSGDRADFAEAVAEITKSLPRCLNRFVGLRVLRQRDSGRPRLSSPSLILGEGAGGWGQAYIFSAS